MKILKRKKDQNNATGTEVEILDTYKSEVFKDKYLYTTRELIGNLEIYTIFIVNLATRKQTYYTCYNKLEYEVVLKELIKYRFM